MLYLLFGDNQVALRNRLQALLAGYPATAVNRVAVKDIDYGAFGDYFVSKSMFDDKQVVVVEGKLDVKKVSLEGARGKAALTDVVIVVDGGVKSNEGLYKAVEELGGAIEKFEEEPEREIFGFLDAVARKQRKVAMGELCKLWESGKEPIYVQTMLVWQFRQIIAPELAKGFVQKKAEELRRGYTDDELFKIYAALYQLEVRLKTGEGVSEALVEEFVVRITK